MAYAAAFPRYANLFVEGKNYNHLDKLWSAVAPDKSLVKEFDKASCKGAIDFALLQRLADVHNRMRKSGNNRGGRAQNPATTVVKSVRKATASNGVPSLCDMDPLDEVIFGTTAGVSEPFDANDITEDSCGHCFSTAGQGGDILYRFLLTAEFSNICTMVCKQASFDAARPQTRADIRERYKSTTSNILFACKKTGTPYDVPCNIFNFGLEHTCVAAPPEPVTAIESESTKYVQISVQLQNLTGTADFGSKGKAPSSSKPPWLSRLHTSMVNRPPSLRKPEPWSVVSNRSTSMKERL